MKRSLLALTLMLSMALVASAAMASSNTWYGQNTNATISNVVWNNTVGSVTPKDADKVNGVSGYDQYNWGYRNKAQADVHDVDSKFDLDVKRSSKYSYYGYELNYLHMDFETADKEHIGKQIAPSKLQVYVSSDFSWEGYQDRRNPIVGTVGTYIDFHYMETAAGTVVYTVGNTFSLGNIAHGGKEYFFYAVNDVSKLSKSTLEGDLYDQALANIGGDAGTELYGWFAKPGDNIHFKFDIMVTDRDINPAPPAVPVPAAAWLLGTGLAGLVGLRRHHK